MHLLQKKKKKFWKIRVNLTRLVTRLNPWPVWPATRLTRLKMTRLTRDPWPDWPDPNPTRPARFAMSTSYASDSFVSSRSVANQIKWVIANGGKWETHNNYGKIGVKNFFFIGAFISVRAIINIYFNIKAYFFYYILTF